MAKGWCRRRGDQGRGPARPRAGAGRLALLMLAREGARRIRRRPAGPVQAASPGDAQRGRPAGPSAAVGPGAPPAGSPNQHQSGSAPQSESPRHCGRAATADAEAGASGQAGARGPRAGSSPGPSVQTPGAGGRRKDAAPGMGSSAVGAGACLQGSRARVGAHGSPLLERGWLPPLRDVPSVSSDHGATVSLTFSMNLSFGHARKDGSAAQSAL